ncbi:non-ribosomal peptide synthetase [Streptomyces bugieae]|uniref:Amino acid adenylation domain-containing protein n=1 Tax=Streptomyces bugieae TaxID=3098223 RepID=A0ABU7NH01_9ACTN|nr:amino acid adenylation domain-containing protein [Streptomyces sp. DSM 41528]
MTSDDDAGNAVRPADSAQTRFFLLDQQGGRATTLLQHIRIDGPVDEERMTAAARAVCRAQPALRTSLHPTAEGLVQRTHPVSEVDIRTGRADDESALDGWIAEARAPLPHGAGPLCRIRIVGMPGRTHCLVGVHHAVFDEDSAAVLLRQLARAYAEGPEALTAADPHRPAPQPARRAALHAFWADHLAGAPTDTALPHLPTAPGGGTGHGVVSLPLDAALTAALRERARESGATPFAQVLAAVAVVVGWYGDTEDVVLASVATTRTAADAEVIGCLQNTLPVRLPLHGADTASVLDRATDALFDALDHCDLPIEDILTVSGATRRPGRTPLTQIICTQATAAAPLTTGDLRWQLVPAEDARSEYGLAVTLHQDPAGALTLTVGYDRAALPAASARLFAEHLAGALAAFGTAPAAPLTALRLYTPGPPPPATPAAEAGPAVPELISEHARHTPGATALIAGSERVTYAELDRRVRDLAAALIEAGVRPGDRVGVCLPRTADLLVALVAAWRAGAAYLPLDPGYPAGRLRMMVEDARPAVVVGDAAAARVLASTGVTLVGPDTVAGRAPEQWPVLAPQDPAYVIHTSGSTGRPKGVIVRHGNLAALFSAFAQVLPEPPQVSVAGASVSFDISVLELFWPLATGRTVLLTSHQQVADAEVPRGALYQCTPTMARILADDPAGRRLLGGLAVLFVGGEPLARDLADRLTDLVPGPVFNCYGPTETTVWSTVWRVEPQVPVHIGRPLAGEECRVVDAHGRPLPPGVPGRLLILGAGVGSGYWQRPDLTAERFAEHDGRSGYDTGDLAALDPEHGLRFLGRADTQVKVLGQRIELAEIETVLRAHPAVQEAVATVSGDGTAVTACLIPTDPASPAGDGRPRPAPAALADELRRHAAVSLVPAMVPAAWLLVEALPQLPNGKLDRAAVADWAPTAAPAPVMDEPSAGPHSGHATEVVRRAWEHVLGAPVRGLDTHFFDLGGTSGQIVRVLALLQRPYPKLTTADLFRYTTVRAIARHVDAAGDDGGEAPERSRPVVRAAARTQALNGWRRRTERSR